MVMRHTSARYRRIFLALGKGIVSLVAIAIIISQIKLDSVVSHLYRLNTLVIAATLLVLLIQITVIAGFRLSLVLESVGVNRPVNATSRVALAGFFFEQVAFGFVGGDGMRMWLLHCLGVAPRKSLQAIVVDRCLGLFALLLLAFF